MRGLCLAAMAEDRDPAGVDLQSPVTSKADTAKVLGNLLAAANDRWAAINVD